MSYFSGIDIPKDTSLMDEPPSYADYADQPEKPDAKPQMSFKSSSEASGKSDGSQNSGWDSSGWTVATGMASATSSNVPWYMWASGMLLLLVAMKSSRFIR